MKKHHKVLLFNTAALSLAVMLGMPDLKASAPLGDFFKETIYAEPSISPNGTKLAIAAQWKARKALAIIDLKTKQPRIVTAPGTFDVANIQWIGNNRLLFNGVEPADFASTKGFNGGLFAIDIDGRNPRTLCDNFGNKGNRKVGRGAYMARHGDSLDEVLITSNERLMVEPDVFRVNVHTGAKREVARNPGAVRGWLADHKGSVRIAYRQSGLDHSLLHRETDRDEWREIKRWKFADGDLLPLAFDADNKLVYVLNSLGRDTRAVCLLDPGSGEIIKELFANETYDAGTVVLAEDDHRLLGFEYNGERPASAWADRRTADLQAMLDQELASGINTIYSSSKDRTWMIIDNSSDRNPGDYYLFNTKELTLEKIVSRMDWINPDEMSEMRPISYKARDGMIIHGYLTLPAGKEPRNLPLVVNPHGGPWARDDWGFNPEVQFLASRGYAVLQMNFRSSLGYGKKLHAAGFGQWGLAMQDDITDSVKWAIEQGYADPKRVAIYGASYGGYATMAGLVFTPELYRCGVNYVGVTDIKLLLKTIPPHWEYQREEMELRTGNSKKDSEQLDKTSPMKNADLIIVPVFFAYGELDERVDLKHATRFISKLKSNGIPVESMVKPDEGHGYHEFKNKVDFYTTLERFLNANMK